MTRAALPWSPASCHRIWRAARAHGESEAGALARLDRAERRTLARDGIVRRGGMPPDAVPPPPPDHRRRRP